jgi:NAD(P)-dependent dehydrogenase (short-subunit alcohol dehydrogenase family)
MFLTGRNLRKVEVVAKGIVDAGGSAEAAQVDALDERAVDGHLQSVVDKASRVDVSFNAVGIPNTMLQGVPLVDLDVNQFMLPIATYARSYFLTARLAARRMVANGSGVIMTITAVPSRVGHPITRRLRFGAGHRRGSHQGVFPRSLHLTAFGYWVCERTGCRRQARSRRFSGFTLRRMEFRGSNSRK